MIDLAMPKCTIHTDTELICPKCEGAKGGKRRAKKHTAKELSKWAKLGGRPPSSPKGAR